MQNSSNNQNTAPATLIKCANAPHYHPSISSVKACFANAPTATFTREGTFTGWLNTQNNQTPTPNTQNATTTQPAKPTYEPSDRAVQYYIDLCTATHTTPPTDPKTYFTSATIRPAIDRLKDLRYRQIQAAKNTAPTPEATPAPSFSAPLPAPRTKLPLVDEGYYVLDDTYYKVILNDNNGRKHAKAFNAHTLRWSYAKGAIYNLTPDHKITAAQSKRFGELYSKCIFCSRKLSTEESKDAGYGPDCAEKYGLPWGNK